MNWQALATEEEHEIFRLLQRAREVAEKGGGVLLCLSGVLGILEVAYRYDRCQELAQMALVYCQRKTKELEAVQKRQSQPEGPLHS